MQRAAASNDPQSGANSHGLVKAPCYRSKSWAKSQHSTSQAYTAEKHARSKFRSRSRSRSQYSSNQAHTAGNHGSLSSDGVHFTGKAASILKLSAKKKRAKIMRLPAILNPTPVHTVLLGPSPGLRPGLSTLAVLIPVTVHTLLEKCACFSRTVTKCIPHCANNLLSTKVLRCTQASCGRSCTSFKQTSLSARTAKTWT